ncbi:acetyltransferase [uncultured Pontibacter sp.]|uniref:acetyltransferase n=1 Tax=uncultured Pontibacter sp. TaxID=453356 RepID=UPI00261A43B2|nr:acetyltransferase [uncultured Pontibacter sp.]
MDKNRVVIIGASDHCRYTIDIIEQEDKYKIYGVLDVNLSKGQQYAGYSILGYLDDLALLLNNGDVVGGIVAIGDNYTRSLVTNEIKTRFPKFRFINAIHPSVIIGKETKIGEGCVMMAGVIINNNCIIGNHCFLATKASLDHDSIVGDYSSLSPGVTTGGRVIIGDCTAIGIGATLLHYRTIGSNCVVGGGALVNKDVEDNYLVLGVPAKPIRQRDSSEKYL